jgi:hypothetical protein
MAEVRDVAQELRLFMSCRRCDRLRMRHANVSNNTWIALKLDDIQDNSFDKSH